MSAEKQAVSITYEQLCELSRVILKRERIAIEHNVADLAIKLGEYIREYKIDAASFAFKDNQKTPQATAFFNCFMGQVFFVEEGIIGVNHDVIKNNLENFVAKDQTDKKEHQALARQNRAVLGIKDKMEAGLPVSHTEWGSTSDITAILSHVAPHFDNNILSCLELGIIREQWVKAHDARVGHVRPLCFVTHVDGNHWTQVKISEDESVTYQDTLARSTAYQNEIRAKLQRAFPGRKINVRFTGEQKNGWECADQAIKKTLIDLGMHNHPIVTAPTSEARRSAIFDVMQQITGKQPIFAKGSSIKKQSVQTKLPQEENKWSKQKNPADSAIQDAFDRVVKGQVQDASLVGNTVKTNVLTPDNLKAFVTQTVALMKELKLNGPVEVDAPAAVRDELVKLCEDQGLIVKQSAKPEMPKMSQAQSEMFKKMMANSQQRTASPHQHARRTARAF